MLLHTRMHLGPRAADAGPAAARCRPRPRWLAWAVACLAGSAVAQIDPGATATLVGVLQRGEPVPGGDLSPSVLILVRDGSSRVTRPGMVVFRGDRLVTGPDSVAVLAYASGARVYLYPSTRVRIGSLTAELGSVFVRVKGVFRVRTTFVTAGSEGTEYWVSVDRRDEARVVVAESAVSLSSNSGAWPTRLVRAGEYAVTRGGAGPVAAAVDANEIGRHLAWLGTIDRWLPPTAPPRGLPSAPPVQPLPAPSPRPQAPPPQASPLPLPPPPQVPTAPQSPLPPPLPPAPSPAPLPQVPPAPPWPMPPPLPPAPAPIPLPPPPSTLQQTPALPPAPALPYPPSSAPLRGP